MESLNPATVSPQRKSDQSHDIGRYRPEIDGLRAFALIAVIINHFNRALLPSGYLGVDVFFVISGFVITSSLSKRSFNSFGEFILTFYARRIKRLIPALVLFVVITSLMISMFNPNPGPDIGVGWRALFGVSNIHLYRQSADYFSTSIDLNPFVHTWSLGVEEQFYLLFPLIAWITGFTRLSARGADRLFWVILVLSVVSLLGFVYLYPRNVPAAYFLTSSRFWEIGVGCLLFLLLNRTGIGNAWWQKVPSLPIAFAMAIVLALPYGYAIPATILIVVLTCMLITNLQAGSPVFHAFTNSTILSIGLISYSLYLWHWAVISISRWTIGIHWWTVPVQIIIMLAFAQASYRFVEQPLRHASWGVGKWQTIGYGSLISVGAAMALILLNGLPTNILYTGKPPKLIAEGVETLQDPYQPQGAKGFWGGRQCLLADNSETGKVIAADKCTLGNMNTAKTRILVAGNSYSASFTQAFDDLIKDGSHAVTITSSWGASPAPGLENNGPWNLANDAYWLRIIPNMINQLKPGDWIFLVNDLHEYSPKEQTNSSRQMIFNLENSLLRFSEQLAGKGIRLAFLHGNPLAREAGCEPSTAMKQWFSPLGGPAGACVMPDRKQSLERRSTLDAALQSLQNRGKIRIVDLFPVFCPTDQCTYNAADGQILYRDVFGHPSVEAARLSADTIADVLLINPTLSPSQSRE